MSNLSKSVLVIAGSDPSGGAGIQADLKTLTSIGVYGMTAITALTEQNTKGVNSIFEIPVDFVIKQITCCLTDIKINAVYQTLSNNKIIANEDIKIVLDPVMVAKGGHRLLEKNAIEALKDFIKKSKPILTPNIPEAEILTGYKIKDISDMKKAGKKLLELGASNVILKGGHLETSLLTDVLIDSKNFYSIETNKISTSNTHGTGCTMASAITGYLAKSYSIRNAFEAAHLYVNNAIKTAPKLGNGNGPINHCYNIT